MIYNIKISMIFTKGSIYFYYILYYSEHTYIMKFVFIQYLPTHFGFSVKNNDNNNNYTL